ncbi:pyridoxamine 5'-phosphate oxidase family protein [Limosilactobacillus sp.]|uniref:pyridoxamine 5'-phosphate oxidase family protein n=1 Tax=Limosilactobacillus sp. TaxID=2773925 RepID=UPI003F0803B7
MRQAVPTLTNQLTNDDFLQLIVTAFQSVVFGTVDQEGNPQTNVADIELCEKGQLIFATTFEKPFYQRLKGHPQISITALRGSETMNSVGFTLTGIANEVDQQYIDQIFASHPEMEQISGENYSERRSILRPFAITPLVGSIYDLRQSPIFQKSFRFRGGQNV